MQITNVLSSPDFDLYRITLNIPIQGFRDFITPWLITEAGSGRVALVDPGPACGIPSLKESLDALGVKRLDLVLLTHIHIDHAGGTEHLLRAFPEARVVVHPRGVRHLIDPTRLRESTAATLGKDVAYAYGEIMPVREGSILPQDVTPQGFEIVDTPGHSQHHQCYIYGTATEALVFEGEAAGIYLGNGYLRPATPPKFRYETSARSITALKNRAGSGRLILYGHNGHSMRVAEMLDASLSQLSLWKHVTDTVVRENTGESLETLVEMSVSRLVKEDALLAGLFSLPSDIRQRETYFLHNSARGFVLSQIETT